jgi:Protein of unknown function (DUF3592)
MRNPRTLGLLFLIAGLVLLVGSAASVWSTLHFRSNAERAEGVVVQLLPSGRRIRPVIEFETAEGVRLRFSGETASKPPAYDLLERVGVYYRRDNPGDARIDSFVESWLQATVLGMVGLLLSAGGGGVFGNQLRLARLRRWLEQHGLRVPAQITGVDRDGSRIASDRYPWRIRAKWINPQNGQVHYFSSDPLSVDPSPYLAALQIDALVNASDPNQYWLDTRFLARTA